ncbi:MAG: hypothetical protein M1383_03910 [Patescibacteria group bacterium]|nr:hypothetical protein [Patescibacteria group bacterium]
MKKIYVTCSLTHASEEFKEEMARLKQMLKAKFEVLEFKGLTDGTPTDVYHHDIGCVKSCDLLLSECSHPAIGLGFEIATALFRHKPILAVAKQDAKVSRLILGIDSSLFSFMRYNSLEEVADAVEKKMEGII